MPTTHVMDPSGTPHTRCGYRVHDDAGATTNAASGLPIAIVSGDPTCGRCRKRIEVEARVGQAPPAPQEPVRIDWLKLAKDIEQAISDQAYASEIVDLCRRHGMRMGAHSEVLAWAKARGREGA